MIIVKNEDIVLKIINSRKFFKISTQFNEICFDFFRQITQYEKNIDYGSKLLITYSKIRVLSNAFYRRPMTKIDNKIIEAIIYLKDLYDISTIYEHDIGELLSGCKHKNQILNSLYVLYSVNKNGLELSYVYENEYARIVMTAELWNDLSIATLIEPEDRVSLNIHNLAGLPTIEHIRIDEKVKQLRYLLSRS